MRNLWKSCFMAATVSVLATCGGGEDGPVNERSQVSGTVLDGHIANALVCVDSNFNSRCDIDEPYARSDAKGRYYLDFPKRADGPLLALITAGEALNADDGIPIDASYVMTSPSAAYSPDITPFTTLVRLAQEANLELAEDRVRNLVGLPPKFDICIHEVAPPGSLSAGVQKQIVVALKSLGGSFDTSSPEAWSRFVGEMPTRLLSLPLLRIDTKDSAPIVSKEEYIDATFALTIPVISDDSVTLVGKIRGRGHSTWGQPKNPYKVQFKDDASYKQLADVVGMPKNRNWALLADYFDHSLMRNKLAFSLGSSSVFLKSLKWTPSGQHVEVYLNSDYVGVYLLAEDIRIAPERLNIQKMGTDPVLNQVDGGYIVEVDYRLDCYNDGILNMQLVTPRGAPICIDTPDEESITAYQLAFIKNYLVTVENDLYLDGRLDRINLASFVDWYLLSELFRNVDSDFYSSVFLWKDMDGAAQAADRVLNLGPIWDFDRSAGNANYLDGENPVGCWVNTAVDPRLPNDHNWLAALSRNPAFVDMVIQRWKEKRPALEIFITTSIDSYAIRLDAPQARNFAVWQISPDQAWEVAKLRAYLLSRMAWLDQAYESAESFNRLCR